jgi:hypothetical protein
VRRLLLLLALLGTPALARDSLGMFGEWGVFRDPAVPRCYAIAKALPSTHAPRLPALCRCRLVAARPAQPGPLSPVAQPGREPRRSCCQIGRQVGFNLTGGGSDAWAADKRDERRDRRGDAIGHGEMTVSARGADGRGFSNTWKLDGAATAMDAAADGLRAAEIAP